MKNLLLLIIPVLILFNVSKHNTTLFWKGKYDPEYCYLLNGLNLLNLNGVGHTDHPGTTTQVISSIIIKVTHELKNSNNDLNTDVLIYPEFYLKRIAWSFSIINILLIVFLGFLIFKLTNNIIYGLLFQLIPFFSSTLMKNVFYRISPEPLLFFSVIVLIIVVLAHFQFQLLNGKLNYGNKKFVNLFSIESSIIIFAIVIGFALATKVNSIPLIILPLLLIKGKKNRFLFLFFSLVCFIFFTLPIIKHYGRFFYWIASIVIHSGKYGHGTNEIINAQNFANSLLAIFKNEPFFVFIIFLSLVFIVKWLISNKHDSNFKILSTIFIVQIIGIVIVAKHFSLHYLVPIIPTISLNIFIMISYFKISKIYQTIIVSLIFIICFKMNVNFRMLGDSKTKQKSNNDINVQNIYSYGCQSKIYALHFGNYWSKRMYSENLEKIYGQQYFYSLWEAKIFDWDGNIIEIDSIINNEKELILNGSAYYIDKMKDFPFKKIKISDDKYLIEPKK